MGLGNGADYWLVPALYLVVFGLHRFTSRKAHKALDTQSGGDLYTALDIPLDIAVCSVGWICLVDVHDQLASLRFGHLDVYVGAGFKEGLPGYYGTSS